MWAKSRKRPEPAGPGGVEPLQPARWRRHKRPCPGSGEVAPRRTRGRLTTPNCDQRGKWASRGVVFGWCARIGRGPKCSLASGQHGHDGLTSGHVLLNQTRRRQPSPQEVAAPCSDSGQSARSLHARWRARRVAARPASSTGCAMKCSPFPRKRLSCVSFRKDQLFAAARASWIA